MHNFSIIVGRTCLKIHSVDRRRIAAVHKQVCGFNLGSTFMHRGDIAASSSIGGDDGDNNNNIIMDRFIRVFAFRYSCRRRPVLVRIFERKKNPSTEILHYDYVTCIILNLTISVVYTRYNNICIIL